MLALLTEGSFESGRNDYGAYIKFPDGTLIMCGSVKINVTENNTYSGSATVKYPMSPFTLILLPTYGRPLLGNYLDASCILTIELA